MPIVNYVYDAGGLGASTSADIDRTAGFLESYARLVGAVPVCRREVRAAQWRPIGGTTSLGSGMEHQTMTTLDSFGFTLVTAHELFRRPVVRRQRDLRQLGRRLAQRGLCAATASTCRCQAFGRSPAAARATGWTSARARALRNRAGTVRVPDTTDVARIFSD
ncbi:MAG: hypothetical protein WKG07_04615 [Hymenobacter sp.]